MIRTLYILELMCYKFHMKLFIKRMILFYLMRKKVKLISPRLLLFFLKINAAYIYDLRSKNDFLAQHISGSKNLDAFLLRSAIKKHLKNDIIIFVCENHKKWSGEVTWVRKNVSKHTFLLKTYDEKVFGDWLVEN